MIFHGDKITVCYFWVSVNNPVPPACDYDQLIVVPSADRGDNQTLAVKNQYILDQDKPSKHFTEDLKM